MPRAYPVGSRFWALSDESKFTRKRARFEGELAGALFGTMAVFIKLLREVHIFAIAFWRLVIAFLILAAVLFFSGSGILPTAMAHTFYFS